MRKRINIVVTVFLAMSLCGLIAGTAGATTGNRTTTTKLHGVIEIGVEGPLTGIYAEVGEGFVRGAQAAVNEINSQGGVLGEQIGIVPADDQNDPGDAVPALVKLIHINHIVALDGPNSTVLPALTGILTSNHINTMFQGGSTFFDTNGNRWLWRPSPSDSQLGVAMAAYALSKGDKRAAVLITSAATAETLAQTVEKVYKKNGGNIVTSQTVQPSLTSYQSAVEAIINAKPQVVFLQVDPTTAAPLLTEFEQFGASNTQFIGSDLTEGSDFISAISATAAHRELVSIAGSTNAGASGATFVNFYRDEYHSQPLSGANYSYDGIMELALAIQEGGSTNPYQMNAAISAISDPKGEPVYNWSQALAALKAHKSIHYLGAGGPSGFDRHHNATGAFAAFQANTSGSEQAIAQISVADLQAADKGTLRGE